MTKDDLAEKVAKQTGYTKQAVVAILNSFMEQTVKTVTEGGTLTIRGFGTFAPVVQKEKKAQHMGLKQTITIPARLIPKFTPSLEFKEKVREAGDIAAHLAK